MVRNLSDDTEDSDNFGLLTYGTWRYDLQVHVALQMETRDGVVLAINATCANIGDTACSQLLAAHALSDSDDVSYPFGKDYASILKTLTASNFNLNLHYSWPIIQMFYLDQA